MTLWIRVDAGIGEDPKVWKLSHSCGVSAEATVGLLVILFGKVAEHRTHGNLSDVPDALLERWCGWNGEVGRFASAFRALFVTDGVLDGWEERQGKLIERQQKERERWHRRRLRGDSASTPAARNGTLRNSTTTPSEGAATPAPANPVVPPKKEKPPREPAPWMGEVRTLHRKHYGGDPPKGSATSLGKVVREVGDAEMLSRLDRYFSLTPAAFVNIPKFASTHGSYAPGAQSPTERVKTPTPEDDKMRFVRLQQQIDDRKQAEDGDDWWARMEREARAKGARNHRDVMLYAEKFLVESAA